MGKVQVKAELDEETFKMLEFIQKWLNTNYRSEAVKFCIKQVYDNLAEGRLSIIRD